MSTFPAMQPRQVRSSGTRTPLLVPSFSSVDSWGHGRFDTYASSLGERLLLSAYDLHHHGFDATNASNADLVIVDSGGYEARVAERYARWLKTEPLPWTSDLYDQTIRTLPEGPNYLLVTFDHGTQLTYNEQMAKATSFSEHHSGHGIDWLLKPEPGQAIIKPDRLHEYLAEANQFEVLGVTYDELGRSLNERVQHMAQIRQSLDNHGCTTPIHVFGCLTFSAILPLVRAGADIFDGLAWTRHILHRGMAINIHDHRILKALVHMHDDELFPYIDATNLDALDQMQDHIRKYAADHDGEWLRRWCPELLSTFSAVTTKGGA